MGIFVPCFHINHYRFALFIQLRGLSGREKLAKLPEPQRCRINKILADIQKSTAATALGVRAPGSDTMKNLSIAYVIGKLLHFERF